MPQECVVRGLQSSTKIFIGSDSQKESQILLCKLFRMSVSLLQQSNEFHERTPPRYLGLLSHDISGKLKAFIMRQVDRHSQCSSRFSQTLVSVRLFLNCVSNPPALNLTIPKSCFHCLETSMEQWTSTISTNPSPTKGLTP